MSYITRQQAAELLGVSLRTLDGMIQRGSLPAYKIGSKLVRLKDSDLEEYVEAHRVAPEIKKPKQRKCTYVPGMKVV